MSRTITSGTDDNGEEFVNCDGLQSTKKTDDFGRVTSINTSINSAAPFITTYQYFGGIEENSTSNTVNRLENHYKGNCYAVYNYTYDNNGNITQVKLNGTLISKYTYDSLNQLYEEYDYLRGRYINYTYDNGGNIKLALESYLNSSGTIGGVCGSKNYTYGDSVWKDKLTKYGTYNITYDEIGNPLNYRDGITFSWKNGRWLASTTLSDNTTVTYQYNANGMRTKKTVGSTVTNYYYDSNNNLIGLKSGSDVAFFYYGADNSPVSMKYNNNMYYYVKNLQGDIVKILDSNGGTVAGYYYDAWGTITGKTVNNATIDTLSPFRYRGYVYDSDTGFYYLQSRYYDPTTGRFINADDTAYIGVTGTVLSGNLFAYCENNPGVYFDDCGNLPKNRTKKDYFINTIEKIKSKQTKFYIFSKIYINSKRFLFEYTIDKNGVLLFNFKVNPSYATLFDKGRNRIVAEAIFKAVYMINKKYKSKYLKGRTIGGINSELSNHYRACYLGILTTRANPANIGSIYKNNIGYDSNACYFEPFLNLGEKKL